MVIIFSVNTLKHVRLKDISSAIKRPLGETEMLKLQYPTRGGLGLFTSV